MRRLIAPLLACLAAPAAGCVLSGQPCSDGRECPTGYACSQGSCEPVGGGGAMLQVHVGLPEDGINVVDIDSLVLESRLDSQLGCRLWRDPTDAARFESLAPQVVVPIGNFGDPPTEVMVPAGRSIFVVVAKDAGGDVVGQACQVHDFGAGDWDELYFELVRANGRCGDTFLDAGEQCDAGEAGSATCTPSADPEGGCRTRAVAVASGGGCITGPAVACTWDEDAGERGDGRCLVGWIEDGDHLRIASRLINGAADPESESGLDEWDDGVRLLRIASRHNQAAAVWIGSDGLMHGTTFNNMAQSGFAFEAAGDASGAVVSFADFFDRGDGRPVLAAGWIDGNGDGVVEDFDAASGASLAHRTLDMASPPGGRPVAAILSGRVVVAWAEPSFGGDVDEAVVASGVRFDDPSGSEPFLISDNPSQAQTEPSLTRLAYDRVFFAWTDANRELGDDSGTGIRGRRMHPDETGASMAINSGTDGSQNRPAVASGHDYVVAAWSNDDTSRLLARYLDTYGRPQYQPFGDGRNTDFEVAGAIVGRPTIAAERLVYFAWLEEPCGERGGARLMLRTLPPPH